MKLLIEEKTAKKKTQKIYPAAAGRFLLSPDFSVTSDPIAVKIIAKDAKDTESTQASQVPIRVSGRGSETGGKVIIKELNDKQDNQLLKDLNDISIAPIHITTKKAFALFGFLKNLTKYIAYPAASAALLAGLLLSIIFLGNFLGPIQKTLSLAPSAAWSLLVADDTDAVPEAEPLDDSALAQETLEPADVSEPSTQEESLQPSSQEAPADSSNSDLEAPTDNQTTTSQDPSEQTQGTSSDDVNEDELDEPIDSQDQLSADDQETTGSDATQETPDPDTSAQVPFLSGQITESEGDLLGANQSLDAGEEPEQNQPGNDQAQVLEPDPEPDPDEKVVPVITQEPTETGKLVTISAPDEDPENPITNFPATAKIPEIFKVGQEKKIKITWKNNGNQSMPFEARDTNGNGYLDTVDWIVPHLSEQLFDIAYISKAFQLDQNKDILADVYEQVWAKDDSYANLEQGQYLRLTFDQAFTSQNNITVYAKSDTGASIEVYPVYPDGPEITQPVATFETIQGEGFYKVLLTNLSAPTDVFDLKILQNVSVDYVVYTDFDYGPNSILTPQGYKNISELTVGDQVIGYENGQSVINQIENIQFLKPGSRDRWRQDEQGNNIILVETPFTYYLVNETWHLFQDQSLWANDRVVHASELTVGDTIYDTNYQPITITSIRSGEDRVQWLTLTVSGNHSYVADGLLLHNASRYWVGGGSSANWNATGNTNWASSSNGSNNASVPTSSDDVFFDGVGGGASNSTLSADITIRSLNMTGYTNTLTHNSAVTLSIGDGTAGASNNAFILGSLTYTLGSATTSAIDFISTSTTAQNVNGNGKTLGNVTFNGAAGSWKLTGTLTTGSTATVTLTQGSLEANGQAMSIGKFASSNSNTRTLNLNLLPIITVAGTGTAWNITTTTGLTFSMDSSQITLSGSGADFSGGGLSYNDVSLTGAGSQEVSGANTFMIFNRTGTASKTNVLILSANQTVTSGFTLQGNSATNRLLVESNIIGTSRTITQNAMIATIANVDLSDITGAGTGSWNLAAITGNSGDAGGNSGITFTTATTRYWVGGTGSWSSTGEWATSSGGAGGAYVPLPQDAVVFDANSFSAGSQTVTADMPRLGKSINWTGATNSPTLALDSTTNTIYGSLTLISAMSITVGNTTVFQGRDSFALTSAGVTLGPVTVEMVGGTLTLQDHFLSGDLLTISNGVLNANNKNVTASSFSSNNSNTRTITMGSGTWTATGTGTVWSTSTTTGLTLNANTSTIKMTNTSSSNVTFSGGGLTFNNLWWARGASTGSNITTGSNTFADFKDDGSAAHSLLFAAGSTQTVTTFTVSGSSGNVITINTNGSTATHALVKSGGGTISSDYLNIQHSVATPSNTWYAGTNSTDNQSVATAGSGWIFSGVPSITIGGTVYTDEGTTNIGANKTVAVSINGAAAAGTDDTDASGVYSITGLNIVAGDILTLYLDGETEKAVTVTAASGSNQTSVHLFQNYLIARQDNSGSLTNANLETAETNADSDISDIYSVASSNLTVAAGKSLYIPSSHTFAPGGTVSVGGNFSNNGTFTHGSSTVTLTGTSTQTLKSNSSALNNLTINGSGSTYTLQDALDVNGTITLSAGALDASASNFGITAQSWTDTGAGTFTERAGTVTFDVAGGTINSNETFENVTINHAGTTTLGAALDLDDTLTLTAGTLDVSGSNYGITLKSWTDTGAGSFTERSGTVTFDITSGTINSNEDFYNLTLNHTGTNTTLGAALSVSNDVTLTDGTLDTSSANNYAITVGGSWSGASTLTPNLGTVTFTATTTGKTITTAGDPSFYNLTFNGVGGEWTLQDTVIVSNVLTITNGTLNGGSATLRLDGDTGTPFVNSGTFTANTGTVDYRGNNASGNTTITNVAYYNLTTNFSAETYVLAGNTTVNNTLDINKGTLDVVSGQNYSLTVGGNWDVGGTTGFFTARSGTVTLTSTSASATLTSSGDSDFYNLIINGSGGTYTLQDALVTTNNLTLTAGTLDVSASNFGITANSWTDTGAGTFTERNGTVTFDVAGGTINSNEDFYNVTVNHGGISTLGADTSITNVLTITSGTLNASSYALTLSGTTGTPFSNSGTFTASTGTVTYTGNNSGGNTTVANVAYNNLTLNNSLETFVLGATLDVDDTLTLTAGTLDVSGSNYGITTKSWTDTGTGAFTEGSGTVTFDVAGGTINSNETFENVTINHAGTTTLGAALDLDDTLTITSGALDVSGSNYGITLKSWTDTGAGTFTEQSGTVTFDVAGGTLNSNDNFNDLVIDHAGTTTLGAALDVNDDLTLTAGTLDVSGSNYGITIGGDWTDTGSATFTEQSGIVTFDGTGSINANETFNNVTINSSGTVTLAAALDLAGTLTLTAGTLDISGSNYGITAQSWTDSGSGSFTEGSGTVTFDVAGGTINSNETFENVTINHAGTTTLGATLDLDDTLTITAGALDVSGSNYGITLKSWTDTGSGTFTEGSGTVTFDITGGTINSNETFENVTINHAGTTTLGAALDLDDTLTLSGGALDVSSSNYGITLKSWTDTGSGTFTEQSGTVTFDVASGTINSNETFENVTINHAGTTTLGAALDLDDTLTISAGTLDVSGSNYAITLKSWTDTGPGTFTEGSGTVTFDVAGGTINSNEAFNDLVINHAGTTTLGAALDVDDDLTLTAGTLDVSSSNYGITVGGDWTDAGSATFTEQSGTVTFDGTSSINANETFNNVTINSSGTVTLAAALDLAGTLTLTAGTLDISASNFGITAKSWTDTGSGTFTERSGTVTFDVAGGIINSNETFENVTINHAGTTTLGAALDLDGNLTITSGTLDASGSNYAITLAGNWSNAGTFTARAGTVTLDGTNQSISGSASFYNLSKTVTSAATLTFEAAATQTIISGGTVTFHGASGQLLSLVSSSSPTQWKITVNGSTSMDYLDVKDSDASGGTAIAQTNSTDSGHNLNWLFNQDPTFTSISHTSGYIKAGNTVIFTAVASDADSGDTITLYICKANDFTGTVCGAGGEWAHSSASATNPTAIYTVQSSDADGSHAYYANIIDNDNAEASANPRSGAFTTDVTAPIVDAGVDQTKPDPFVTTATASDALSGVSLYQWSQTSGPGTLTFGSDTSLNTTVSANSNGTYVARLTVTDNAGNTAYDEFTLIWTGSGSTTTSGGGGGRGNPCTVPECGVQTTEPLSEPDTTGPSQDTGILPGIGQQIDDIVDTIGDAISDILFPTPKPKPLPLPPIETVVTEPAPIALRGAWDLLFGKQIREFLFAPLPADIKNLALKLPELQKTFKATGIVTLNSTVQKLQGIELTVPGLGWRIAKQQSGSGDSLLPAELDSPGFALPKNVPLAHLPVTLKKELPTEIVFFRSKDELIDYRTIISLNDKGEAEQKITVISGKDLVLAVRPERPADSVKGYIILRSLALRQQGFGLPSQASIFDTVFGSVALAATPPAQPMQSHILLSEFEYADGDGDGVYTANVQAPLVDGQYEVITVINYKDITIGSHQVRLIMVVDPEGYVYRSVSGGELRISNAAVSLHWLNPQTKEYQLWPAEEYQQENPRVTDKTGKYSFLVPEGLYYLEVSAPGYDKFRSETFTVKEGEGIHMNIQLQSQHWSEGMWGWKGLAMAALALLMSFVYVIFIGNKRR